MLNPTYLLIPVISALIGWLTNKMAIWLLYYPKHPVHVLGLTIQGIFPKRQQAIANRIGEMVASNLLTNVDMKNKIFTPSNIQEVRVLIEGKLTNYLNTDFKENNPLINFFVSQKKKDKITQEVLSKLDDSIQDLNTNFTYYLEEKVNIKQIVTEKISSLDSDEVNQLMQNVLSKEFKFIEYIGGIIGFLIGILQVLFIIYL